MVIDPNNVNSPHGSDRQRNAASSARGQDNAAGSVNQQKQAASSAAPAPAATNDSVKLSSQAQSLQELEAKMGKLSDVDSEKVAKLKQAIDSGEYQVDAQKVAGKMLEQDKLFA